VAVEPAGKTAMLLFLGERMRELDPDVIEGHNLFNPDLHYIRLGLSAGTKPGPLRSISLKRGSETDRFSRSSEETVSHDFSSFQIC